MKFLNDKDYNALKAKADHFDTIVAHVLANGENINAEDVTAETVIQSMQTDSDSDDSKLQQSVTESQTASSESETNSEESEVEETDDLQAQLDTANATIAALNEQIASFNAAPATDPGAIAPKSDPDAQEMDIATFADKNKGDTNAILARAKEEGLI
jgi:uncharacterized protein (DUF885 family)